MLATIYILAFLTPYKLVLPVTWMALIGTLYIHPTVLDAKHWTPSGLLLTPSRLGPLFACNFTA